MPQFDNPMRDQPMRDQPMRDQPMRTKPMRDQPMRDQPMNDEMPGMGPPRFGPQGPYSPHGLRQPVGPQGPYGHPPRGPVRSGPMHGPYGPPGYDRRMNDDSNGNRKWFYWKGGRRDTHTSSPMSSRRESPRSYPPMGRRMTGGQYQGGPGYLQTQGLDGQFQGGPGFGQMQSPGGAYQYQGINRGPPQVPGVDDLEQEIKMMVSEV
jgi:hypothetical protein